jgi:AcrR family transcriptional regulator
MPRPVRAAEPVNTHSRIQQVALELFTEQGYEATSLREIAERLGVTKAALYYHFRTKDEIVQSLLHDMAAKLDELIAWGVAQPRTPETRREFIRRYAALLFDGDYYGRFMRFIERNQTSVQKLRAGTAMHERMVAIQAILSTPHAAPAERLRCSLAVIALHSSWFALRTPEITDDQRRHAALAVALDLVA